MGRGGGRESGKGRVEREEGEEVGRVGRGGGRESGEGRGEWKGRR